MRASGRTYRMLLKAQLLMSEGNDVVITAPRHDYVKDLFKHTLRMMHGYLPEHQIDFNPSLLLVQIKEVKGSIIFVSERNFDKFIRSRCIKNLKVLHDEQDNSELRNPYTPEYQVKS